MFPEVRINTGDQDNLFPEEPEEEDIEELLPDIIKCMDMQQEMLARSLGDDYSRAIRQHIKDLENNFQ
jgi:hypothetical protein